MRIGVDIAARRRSPCVRLIFGRRAAMAGCRRRRALQGCGRTLALLLLNVCVSSVAFAQDARDVPLKTVVNAKSFFVGEVFPFFIIVDGTNGAGAPRLPESDSLKLRYVGGQSSQADGKDRFTLTFEAIPLVEGNLEIPALEIEVKGQFRWSEAVAIPVKAPEETGKIALLLSLSSPECYVGEPVVLTVLWESDLFLSGFRAVDIRVPALNDPRIDVFEPLDAIDPNDTKAIGVPVAGRRVIAELDEQKIDDKPYMGIQFRKVLVPRVAGELEMPGATLLCSYNAPKDQKFSGFRYPSYFNNDFFDDQVRGEYEKFLARSEPLRLKVKPLPAEGRPEDFSGIIGRVRLSVDAEPLVVSVSEPVRLTLLLQSHPFPQTLELPPLGSQSALGLSFNISEDSSSTILNNGDKVFTRVIRPKRENIDAIPAVQLSFFDPEDSEYGEAVSQPIPIKVMGAMRVDAFDAEFSDGSQLKNNVARSPTGINYNYRGSGLLAKARPAGHLAGRASFWAVLLLIPSCFFGLVWFSSRQWRFAQREPAAARARKAYPVFSRSIDALKNGRGDRAEATEALKRAVNAYVADRLGLVRGAVSSEEMAALLRARRVNTELLAKLEEFLERSDSARFSPRPSNGDGPGEMVREIPVLISRIERDLER